MLTRKLLSGISFNDLVLELDNLEDEELENLIHGAQTVLLDRDMTGNGNDLSKF